MRGAPAGQVFPRFYIRWQKGRVDFPTASEAVRMEAALTSLKTGGGDPWEYW